MKIEVAAAANEGRSAGFTLIKLAPYYYQAIYTVDAMVVFEWPLPTLIAAIYYGLYKPLQSNFPRGDETLFP